MSNSHDIIEHSRTSTGQSAKTNNSFEIWYHYTHFMEEQECTQNKALYVTLLTIGLPESVLCKSDKYGNIILCHKFARFPSVFFGA